MDTNLSPCKPPNLFLAHQYKVNKPQDYGKLILQIPLDKKKYVPVIPRSVKESSSSSGLFLRMTVYADGLTRRECFLLLGLAV